MRTVLFVDGPARGEVRRIPENVANYEVAFPLPPVSLSPAAEDPFADFPPGHLAPPVYARTARYGFEAFQFLGHLLTVATCHEDSGLTLRDRVLGVLLTDAARELLDVSPAAPPAPTDLVADVYLARIVRITTFPSQWNAWDGAGRYYYLKYRSGVGRVWRAKSPDDPALGGNTGIIASFQHGGRYDGDMGLAEFLRRAGIWLAPSAAVIGEEPKAAAGPVVVPEDVSPAPAEAEACGRHSRHHRLGGVLGPCIKPPGHGDEWHLDATGAAWDPATDREQET